MKKLKTNEKSNKSPSNSDYRPKKITFKRNVVNFFRSLEPDLPWINSIIWLLGLLLAAFSACG